jgi:imidazolonepropionase-like amidohydrolase
MLCGLTRLRDPSSPRPRPKATRPVEESARNVAKALQRASTRIEVDPRAPMYEGDRMRTVRDSLKRSVTAGKGSLGLAAIALLLMCISAHASAAPDSEIRAVLCGSVLEVRSGQSLKDRLVTFDQAGRITAVRSASPADATRHEVLDLSGMTCLPGLIDSHTHLNDDPGSASYSGLSISVPRAAIIGAKNARLTLLAGFTTVRNMTSIGYSDVALRDGINAGDVPGPRMVVSGPALSITGGHNDQNLLAPEFRYRMDGVADGVDGVKAKVRENIKYGADVIKVMATGGVMSEGDSPGAEQYGPDELRTIVETAHGLGRKVAAHAHGTIGIKDATLAGVDSIEHGSYIDAEGIRLMKARGTYLVPTLYVGDWLFESYAQLGLTQNMIDKLKAVIPQAREHVARAFAEHVKVAFGTDAGVYPHGLNAREFAVMVKLGMTPLAAIQSATINAADLLGWGDKVGAIEPGHYADLIAIEGDPVANVRLLENVKFVMKGGLVYRDEVHAR